MITLPWGEGEVAYVAALLRDRAQGKVDMASLLLPGSLVTGLRADLADQAIRIGSLATDLLQAAEVTTEREDDLAAVSDGDPAG